MSIKKHIPNFLTCCNLICGCIGIVMAFDGRLEWAAYLIFIACVFDFFDGFAARLLHVASPIGKELDSMADMVSFGLLPGIIIFEMTNVEYMVSECFSNNSENGFQGIYSYAWILIPVFSALRLAKFNIDERQSSSFIGLPTPANAVFIASLPLIIISTSNTHIMQLVANKNTLIAMTVILSYLLVSPIALFALKFKNFSWNENKIRYIFLISSLLLFIVFKFIAIPIIIILYIILSLLENNIFKGVPGGKS